MPESPVIDNRLKIASATLRSYRRLGDPVLIDFWQTEVDRLLDRKLATKEPVIV